MPTYPQLLEALCSSNHIVTDEDLKELKALLDKVWNRLNIDVAFTGHFLDRVNDTRNKRQITVCELAKLFMEAYKKFGQKLAHITQREWEAVLTDSQTNVNVPFVLKHNGRELTIVAKTVMRKPDFFTPDPKLAVAHYEPGTKKMAKTYSELKEWIGFNTPEVAPIAAPQAVDDVDNGAMYVEDPMNLDKLNAYLADIGNKPYMNPYYPLNHMWKKLSFIGLNFDMRDVTFVGIQGRVSVPLNQYGGRYGVLGDPTTFVSADDGISNRLPGGLNLVITFMKTNGVYHLDAHLERGVDNSPFVEAVGMKEGEAEEFQAANDNLVGMSEKENLYILHHPSNSKEHGKLKMLDHHEAKQVNREYERAGEPRKWVKHSDWLDGQVKKK